MDMDDFKSPTQKRKKKRRRSFRELQSVEQYERVRKKSNKSTDDFNKSFLNKSEAAETSSTTKYDDANDLFSLGFLDESFQVDVDASSREIVDDDDNNISTNSCDDLFLSMEIFEKKQAAAEVVGGEEENVAKPTTTGAEGDDSIFSELDLSSLERECEKVDQLEREEVKAVVAADNQTSTPIKSTFANKIKNRLMSNARRKSNVQKAAVSEAPIMVGECTLKEATAETQENEKLFYGLPPHVRQLYHSKGITKLYDWQHECLNLPAVCNRENLIYSLPTSGGKTLVAEILMLKTILSLKLNVVVVLPFVALVQEKIQNLADFALELGFIVEEYAAGKGTYPPRRRRKKNVVYICTIEKASSLVDSLIEMGRLDELGLMIIDELHMIGDGGRRGSTIETTISKIMHMKSSVQLVGMSATLSNISDLSAFLNKATIYTNDFRPVKLDEYIKCQETVFKVDVLKGNEDGLVHERFIKHKVSGMEKIDCDHLTSLVMEVIPHHSCLMFCPTKKNCENVALLICQSLPRNSHGTLINHLKMEKIQLLQKLRLDSEGSICPTLLKTIPLGVAYHHSGLTGDERRLIEEAYRSNILCLLTCTSTLAAGVNLPARRVIIRSPRIGNGLLSRAQYRQMIGRAGRAGIDSKGESYLVVPPNKDGKKHILDLISGTVEKCVSSLMYGGGDGFHSMLLNLIGLKIVTKVSQINEYFSKTLFSHQLESNYDLLREGSGIDEDFSLSKLAESSLELLISYKLVELVPNTEDEDGSDATVKVTRIGWATFKGSIDLSLSQQMYKDLKHGLDALCLVSYFHLLYLVTPYDLISQVRPDWMIYMSEMGRLDESELNVAELVGVPERYIIQRASGRTLRKSKVDEFVVCRFYVTLMLYQLFNGSTVWDVAERFDQSRGFLQSLLTGAAAFASRVYHFTQELNELAFYPSLLEKLIQALQHCSMGELVPLMEIPGVKIGRAKQLYKAGFSTLASVASCTYLEMTSRIELLSHKQAKQIIKSAKVLLVEKVESLESDLDELKLPPQNNS